MNHRENEPSALRTFYFVLSILLLALGFLASIWALVGMFVRHMMVWYSFRCMVAILLYSFGGAALYACWDDCFEGDSSKRRRKRGFAFAWLSLLPFALSACLLLLPDRFTDIRLDEMVEIVALVILGCCFLATGLSMIAKTKRSSSRGLFSEPACEGESEPSRGRVFRVSKKIVLGIGVAVIVANVLLYMAVMADLIINGPPRG